MERIPVFKVDPADATRLQMRWADKYKARDGYFVCFKILGMLHKLVDSLDPDDICESLLDIISILPSRVVPDEVKSMDLDAVKHYYKMYRDMTEPERLEFLQEYEDCRIDRQFIEQYILYCRSDLEIKKARLMIDFYNKIGKDEPEEDQILGEMIESISHENISKSREGNSGSL